MLFDDKTTSTYTRAQAIADGILVDVSDVARGAGFPCHTAMTRAAWDECVAWSDEDTARKGRALQDEAGRLWDVLWMARYRAMRDAIAEPGLRIAFEVVCMPREGTRTRGQCKPLALHCGPGDNGAAVFTIMRPGES
jgi:hypothetical protein